MKIQAYTSMIKTLYMLLLFLTPLLVTTKTNEGFEFPKMFFVYFIGLLIIFIFTIQKILIWDLKSALPNIWVLAYLGTTTVSTLASMHLYTSIWGYYSRFNDGIFSVVIFIALYAIAKNVFTKNQLHELVSLTAFTILPISILAIYQHVSSTPNTRVYATLGQPNWLSAYLAMLLPYVLYKGLSTWDKAISKSPHTTTYLTLFILGYIALWFTYSISGLIGFVVGVATFAFCQKQLVLKHKNAIIGLGMMLLVFSLLNLGIFGAKVKDVFLDIRKVYAQTQMVSEDQVSDPGFIRLYIWKGTIDLALSSPKNLLIGTGPETFPYAFQKFRPIQLNYSSEWNYILNKPHNYYLEVLAETGAFGLITYLGLIAFILRKKHAIYLPCFIAFFITNIFGWPTVATTLLFWIFLASVEKDTVILNS